MGDYESWHENFMVHNTTIEEYHVLFLVGGEGNYT
jgi:hypothetical protein